MTIVHDNSPERNTCVGPPLSPVDVPPDELHVHTDGSVDENMECGKLTVTFGFARDQGSNDNMNTYDPVKQTINRVKITKSV